jgi:hypothetical protein
MREVMTRDPRTIAAEASLVEAHALMRAGGFRHASRPGIAGHHLAHQGQVRVAVAGDHPHRHVPFGDDADEAASIPPETILPETTVQAFLADRSLCGVSGGFTVASACHLAHQGQVRVAVAGDHPHRHVPFGDDADEAASLDHRHSETFLPETIPPETILPETTVQAFLADRSLCGVSGRCRRGGVPRPPPGRRCRGPA